MKSIRMVGPVAAACLLYAGAVPVFAIGPAPDAHLAKVLEQMDKASASFKSAEADFHKDLYEALVKQTTPQTGSIYVERKGTTTQMGAKIVGDGAATVEYRNGAVKLYKPGLKCFNSYATGSTSGVESFLTLGFGGSGKELAKTWTITDQGAEKIGNATTEKLDLVPRDPNVANNFKHVTLWVDPDRGVSLKQIFFTPSGDTQTATYTNIRLNQNVNKKPYEITGGPCGK